MESAALSSFPPPSSPTSDGSGIARAKPLNAESLRRELQGFESPSLKKDESASRLELCEEHAARAFSVGLAALDAKWTLRRIAARLCVTERMVRDYRDGFRAVPLPKLLLLPKPARLAALRELISIIPELEALCG